jgi:hypothetical protein
MQVLSLETTLHSEEDAMAPNNRFNSQVLDRMPLQFEFHYEVDDRGEHYRVWAEQLREPIGIGGDLEHFERRLPQ